MGDRFELVSINDSTSTNPAAYVRANGFNWIFGSSDQAGKLYSIRAYPTTLFIDRRGKVVDRVIGGMSEQQFEAKLAQILD